MDGTEYSLHTSPGIQRYAAQVAKIAVALQDDDKFAKQVIDAVHTGSSATVERVLAQTGVETQVSLTTVDETAAGLSEGGAATATAARTTSTTVTVTIGIGPINVSFSFKKDKKTT